ncbi:MAG: shikimate dehydrogenase [Rhodothermales bacterium]|nr:shikimate dehydrogenase [Rhodothermales bacterium]
MQERHFRLGLIGHPVEHSISPVIHGTALGELGLSGTYAALDVHPGNLRAWIGAMSRAGYRGVNVTLPHKQAVLPLMDSLSPGARAIGAVNTITVQGEGLHGDNTDHVGFLNPLLAALPSEIRSAAPHTEIRSAALLGAGGSARSVVFALKQLPALKSLRIFARSPERAQAAIDTLLDGSLDVSFEAWDRRLEVVQETDLIVNSTPIGMWPNTSLSPLSGGSFRPGQMVYDLIYNPRPTRLLQEAAAAGAVCVDGLPMLVGQAAAAFEIWTGAAMPLEAVTRAAERALSL